MADNMDFFAPDPESMSREALLEYLRSVRERIEALDDEEPADMMSEAYEEWGQRHEELEDLADEIMERLES